MTPSRLEPRSGQTKDYAIGICCFSAKNAALKRKTKERLARNRDNVSEWGDMLVLGLLFQWASTKSNNAWSSTKLTSSHCQLTCSRHDIAEKLLSWRWATITITTTLIYALFQQSYTVNKGNNKITELRTILQRESQNS